MPSTDVPKAKLTIAAVFPLKYFLENMAIRHDGSVLVTSQNHKELWYVPPVTEALPVEPVLLHTFEQNTCAVTEVEPDVFYLGTSNVYTTHESFLHRIDLNGWQPGSPIRPETILEFQDPVRGLNGACLIAPRVLLVADCFASLIWRVDLPADRGGKPTARVWLKHYSMLYHPGEMKPEQPGVNGIQFAAKNNYLYYTSTTLKLFMRVAVDPQTHEPTGEPEFVSSGLMADDFILDEDAGVAYVTTHRQNSIDRVPLEPVAFNAPRQIVAGDPFDETLIGPSAGAWGRQQGDHGKVAYFISDGGTASPPPGGPKPAKLLRVEM